MNEEDDDDDNVNEDDDDTNNDDTSENENDDDNVGTNEDINENEDDDFYDNNMDEEDDDDDDEEYEHDDDDDEEHEHDYILNFPEQTEQITSIDARITPVHNLPGFPDIAYNEFMELVSTHHLSDSTGNDVLKWFHKHHLRENVILPKSTMEGREFVNSMNIKHLLYVKTKVMEYENEEYYLYHRPVFDAVKELLSNSDILKYCQWEFRAEYNEQHERVYSEQWTGLWWERVQELIGGTGLKKILSIIIYSDATTLDHLGKSSEHPIYLSLGNIPNWRRNKNDAKVLLGFLPKLKPLHNRKNNKKSFASAKRILYQHCFNIITKPIYECSERNGLNIKTSMQTIWVFPFLSEFIGDLPEDASLTLTYNSSRCKRPCHMCIVTIDEINNPNLSQNQIGLRTHDNMQIVLSNNLFHEYSIYPIRNIFWKFR